MPKAKQRTKRLLLILFLIIEIAVIAISVYLIKTVDNTAIHQYTAVEEIPCDALLQEQEEITFVSNGETQVYQMPISLIRGEAFDVTFSVDCDDTDGGLFFVDLFGGVLYDSPNTEFRRTALEGQYTISDRIYYSGIRPLQCEFRLFTLGDVSATISDIHITRVQEEKNVSDIAIICILVLNAAMVMFVLFFLTKYQTKEALLLSEKEKKGVSYLALGLIICMQVLLMVFWMQQKSNYYVDELYSMEKTQYFSANTPSTRHLYEDDNWEDKTWMKASEWKDTLALSEDESIFFQSPKITMISMVTDRNYNGLLNLAESIICTGEISKYPGIILNMVIFVLTQIVLYCFLIRMGISQRLSLLGVFWYGFCAMTVSMVEYIRFYVLAIFLLLLSVYLHMIMWNTEKLLKFFMCEAGALLCIYFGFRNSELIAPLFLFLAILFTIGLIIRKRFKMAICYGVPVFGVTTVLVLLKTPILDVLTHYTEYISRAQLFRGAGDAVRLEEMLLHMREMTFVSGLKQAFSALQMLVDSVFGGWIFFVVVFLILVLMLICNHRKNEKTVIAQGFYRVIAGFSAAFFFFMICAFAVVPRYYSFLPIWIVSCLISIIATKGQCMKKGTWEILCMASITLAMLGTHLTGKIDYIYQDERAFYAKLEEYKDTDSIVDQTAESFQRSLYDCVKNSGDNAYIYPVFKQNGSIDTSDDQKQVLLWVFPGNDIAYYKKELEGKGYHWNYIGKGDASEVYLFQKD